MNQVMERSVATPTARSGDQRGRRSRQRVPSADVCVGADVAAELVRIIDGAADPNPALVALAVTALDTVVLPTAEHRTAAAAGKVVVAHIDADERLVLWDLLLTDTRPSEKKLAGLRRHFAPHS